MGEDQEEACDQDSLFYGEKVGSDIMGDGKATHAKSTRSAKIKSVRKELLRKSTAAMAERIVKKTKDLKTRSRQLSRGRSANKTTKK